MKRKTGINRACGLVLIGLLLFFIGCKKKSVEQLLEQGRVEAAAKLCQDCEDKAKAECFAKIGGHFFKIQEFKLAAPYYALAGDHARVISCYLMASDMAEAETYCARLQGEDQKKGASLLAQSCYLRGNYQKAIEYYTLAKDATKVSYIQSKIPAFLLLETLNQEVTRYAQSEVRAKITKIRDTLKEYIYFDGYDQWRYGTATPVHADAASLYTTALTKLRQTVAPAFIQTLSQTLASSSWTQKNVDLLYFQRATVIRLTKMIKSLDIIGSYQRFYVKYEDKMFGTSQPGASGFTATYKNALEHGKGLLETLALAEKNTDPAAFPDLLNDLDVDGEILDYIPGMLDNLQARILELESRAKNIRKFSSETRVQSEISQATLTFISQCNQVLLFIGKKEYPKANEYLITHYQKAKKIITDLEKALGVPQTPGSM